MSTSRRDSDGADRLSRVAGAYRLTQMLYVAVKLGIAEMLAGGPKGAEELARAAGAHCPSLARLMRALAAAGIFAEDSHGRFALNPPANRLLPDRPDSLRPFILTYGESWWWASWGQLLHSVRTGETAFDHVHGRSLFEYLDAHPEAAAIFNDNMTAMTGPEAQAVVEAYDFSRANVIVDVGGGHGAFIAALLKANPKARAILLERRAVIEGARDLLEASGVADRCECAPGSFLEEVPGGGDIYTLKDIIHDWDDERSLTILGNCRRAMAGTARLLVIERVIPPGNEPHEGRYLDINMLVLTGGRERTAEEYRDLLDAAGFRLSRIVPTSMEPSVIEAVPS